MTLVISSAVTGQVKEAIDQKADTMLKYIPETKLSENVTIRHIIIEGNDITRRAVILREMSIKEGDEVALDSIPKLLNQNKLRLVNMALFNSVEMRIEKVTKKEVDWYVKLTERWYILPSLTLQMADRNFNTWWVQENHDLRRADVGLTVSDINFRGNLETLAATVQAGYTQKLGINYIIPYLDKKQKNGLGFAFTIARSQQTYYNTDSNKLQYVGNYTGPAIYVESDASINYLFRPGYPSHHIFSLTYKDYWVGDTVIKRNPNFFLNGSNHARLLELQYRFDYNNVDNWNYPLLGFKLVAYAVSRIGFQGLNSQNFVTVETGLFKDIAPNWYVSGVFRGRFVVPQKQPYFFEGGLGTQTDYVRGYEYYVIDGADYGVLRFDLKRQLFNKTYPINIRYINNFPLRIYPKIFADVGYIDSPVPGTSTLSNKLLYSVGIGCDVITLYEIKIRFEFAWNHLGQNGLYLHWNSE